MKQKTILILLMILKINTMKKTNKEEVDENLKLVKDIPQKKIETNRNLKGNSNPKECYLTCHFFPLQYYKEAEKSLLRIRFFSNCLPEKDLVLVSDLNLSNHETAIVRLKLFEEDFVMHFSNVVETNSQTLFNKLDYQNLQIETKGTSIEIDTFSDNNMIIKIIMNPVELDLFEKFKSLAICRQHNQEMICPFYVINP